MPLERVSQGFKDLSMTFKRNPLNDDLLVIKNENAIARSIRNIIFTYPVEKFFTPRFGSKISRLLFENMDSLVASQIEDEIKQSIINYEPRVDLTSINVSPNYETGVFDTVITYLIVGADVPTQQLSFALLPTR